MKIFTNIKLFKINRFLKKQKKLGLRIGTNLYLHDFCNFGSEPYLITIGNNVRISKNVSFITHDGGMWVLNNLDGKKRDKFSPIRVGNNVHIGNDVIIMPGVVIGDNVVIGSGSVVTKSVEANSIVAGIPAKKLKSLEEYKEKADRECTYTNGLSFNEKRKILLKMYDNK